MSYLFCQALNTGSFFPFQGRLKSYNWLTVSSVEGFSEPSLFFRFPKEDQKLQVINRFEC